jgi:hypothetical protein
LKRGLQQAHPVGTVAIPRLEPERAVVKSVAVDDNQITLMSGVKSVYADGDLVLPDFFRSVELVRLDLHRHPVMIHGRLMDRSSNAPIPGAIVGLQQFWRQQPPANTVSSPSPGVLVHLSPPLVSQHAIGDVVARMSMVPVVTEVTLLLEDVALGRQMISVARLGTLGVGSILQLDGDRLDLLEYVVVLAVHGSDPEAAAHLELTHSLGFTHRRNAKVQQVVATTLGTPWVLEVEALSGDSSIFLTSSSGLVAEQIVRITGGSGSDSFHRLWQYRAQTDAEGYYRFPPIHRVAQLELQAQASGVTQDQLVVLQDRQAVDPVDFAFA